MSPLRARYVTACQQLLALGVVVMALVPATRVISLDVVGVQPGQGVAKPSISVSPDQSLAGFARGRHYRADHRAEHRADLRADHRATRSVRVAEGGAG
jgi:hypothetical protein